MTIRNTLLGAAAAVTALVLAGPAAAQASSAQPASGTMTLFLPIALTKVSDLSFGTVVRPTSGNGAVAVNAATGQATPSGGAALMSGGPNAAASRASFTVSGEGGLNFSVTIPATFNMTRSGGSDTLAVALNSTTGGGTLSGTYGSAGTAAFGVGGSVPLSSGTPAGAYSGTFTVTVAYN